MAASADGKGYLLVGSDGGVYTFGDAPFHGSLGRARLASPVVGVATTTDGGGYWLVGADGGVFPYGDASFAGSAATRPSSKAAVVGIAPTFDGGGYWIAYSDGTVAAFGDAPSTNSPTPGSRTPPPVVVAIVGATRLVPSDYVSWTRQAAATCPGLSWTVLAAIAKVESDFGRSTLPGVQSGSNPAGAQGPMQFLPATFAAYSQPVPTGGITPASPYDPLDSVRAAARLLCANGGGQSDTLSQAIYAYNHANWYVAQVEALAASYQLQTAGAGFPGREPGARPRPDPDGRAVPVGRGNPRDRFRLLRSGPVGLQSSGNSASPHLPATVGLTAPSPGRLGIASG